MKYIFMYVPRTKCIEPLLFGNNQIHEDMAKAFALIEGNEGAVAISAGDVASMRLRSRTDRHPLCSGSSDTLQLATRLRDDSDLSTHDLTAGYVGRMPRPKRKK